MRLKMVLYTVSLAMLLLISKSTFSELISSECSELSDETAGDSSLENDVIELSTFGDGTASSSIFEESDSKKTHYFIDEFNHRLYSGIQTPPPEY